ncbi:MAG: hypothetical protein J6X42_05300 [Alphaproteobacteria bacterium]|nr:hypothetical protein [Alphaproteobacteria bacterium]
MTKDVKAVAHRRAQIENFENSDMLKNYLEHRPNSDKLKESLVKGANSALDRIDAENAERKERGEALLPEEYSQLFIDKGVVRTKFDAMRQRENALAEQRASVEMANDVFER